MPRVGETFREAPRCWTRRCHSDWHARNTCGPSPGVSDIEVRAVSTVRVLREHLLAMASNRSLVAMPGAPSSVLAPTSNGL